MAPVSHAKRRILVVCILAALCSALACSSEKNVTAPIPPAPPTTGSGPPIEIRQDAFAYGFLAAVTIRSARLEGRTLRLSVSYAGGCSTHAFAAIGATGFLASYPAQLTVFLRHDAGGDSCDATILDDLSFDVTPAIELFRACNGADGPFYLRIITPPDRAASTLVLYGTNPLTSLRAPATK
jgi:hypothetical protein